MIMNNIKTYIAVVLYFINENVSIDNILSLSIAVFTVIYLLLGIVLKFRKVIENDCKTKKNINNNFSDN